MSTAAISSASIFQELQSFYQTRQSDLKQLGSALQSGDLNGAQQAFSALSVLGEGGPFANSEPFQSSRVQAFNTIGEALQAGDLARAQTAFATLTGNHVTSPPTPATTVSLTSTQPTSTTASADDASSIYQQLQAFRQQRQADVAQLGQDLKAGNLSAAQQDFATLTALGQTGPFGSGQPFQRADRAQDFQAIGQALQSGDLAGAQSAFANLSGTFGKNDQQAQTAISAYNPGPSPLGPPVVQQPHTQPAVFLRPPTQPPVFKGPAPLGPPVVQGPHTEPLVLPGPPTQPPVFKGPAPLGPPVVQGPPTPPPVSLPPFTGTLSTGSSGASNNVLSVQA